MFGGGGSPSRLQVPPALARAQVRRQTLANVMIQRGPPKIKRKSLRPTPSPEQPVKFQKAKDHIHLNVEDPSPAQVRVDTNSDIGIDCNN